MFNILKDENATAAQLTEAFLFFESKGAEIVAKAEKVHAALVELQQKSWSGQNVAKPLKEAKAEYEDLSLQLEAAADAHDKLKRRLGARLKCEMEARILEIDREQEKLSKERKRARNEYLRACAKAAVLRERIEGLDMSFSNMGIATVRLPAPKIDFTQLHGDERHFYEAAVKEARGKEIPDHPQPSEIPESLAGKSSGLCSEKDKIEKALDVYDPELAVEKHLREAGSKAFSLPEPAPEEPFQMSTGTMSVSSGHTDDPPGYENGHKVIDGDLSWGRTSH